MRVLRSSDASPKPNLWDSSPLSLVALILGLITAFGALLGVVISRSGSGDAESTGYLRQFMSGALGTPLLGVALLTALLALKALVSHRRHGLPLRMPVITLGLCALSVVLAQWLGH